MVKRSVKGATGMSRKHAGFTLIELLVVIAIIAILAAILFPLILSAKQAAFRSQCLSNCGQLGKAFETYASDYCGRIPKWHFDDNNAHRYWDHAIYSYVKNKKIFRCPVNKLDSNGLPYPSNYQVRSYALPKNISGEIVEQAPKPSMTVLLYEKGANVLYAQADATGEWFDQTYGYGRSPDHKFWHKGGKNFTFCDGHAKFYRYPSGPFNYNYPNHTAWSTIRYSANPGGKGYCGFANFIQGADPDNAKGLTGANLPR